MFETFKSVIHVRFESMKNSRHMYEYFSLEDIMFLMSFLLKDFLETSGLEINILKRNFNFPLKTYVRSLQLCHTCLM